YAKQGSDTETDQKEEKEGYKIDQNLKKVQNDTTCPASPSLAKTRILATAGIIGMALIAMIAKKCFNKSNNNQNLKFQKNEASKKLLDKPAPVQLPTSDAQHTINLSDVNEILEKAKNITHVKWTNKLCQITIPEKSFKTEFLSDNTSSL